ncbi:MAG: hypothetical protein ACTSYC_00160 [Promethearchaeota archaeon]
MEINFNKDKSSNALEREKLEADIIKVKAHLTCPYCGYKKTFKNKFLRSNIEQMVVSLKIFDWMTCSCGALLNLNLEFEI